MTKEQIVSQASVVIDLRSTLSNAERELAQMVAEYLADGGSHMDFTGPTYGVVNMRLVESAAKRLKAAA